MKKNQFCPDWVKERLKNRMKQEKKFDDLLLKGGLVLLVFIALIYNDFFNPIYGEFRRLLLIVDILVVVGGFFCFASILNFIGCIAHLLGYKEDIDHFIDDKLVLKQGLISLFYSLCYLVFYNLYQFRCY